MPVHKVKGGYRWGTHGHVYKTRAGAERQARAIYASGWRGDGRGDQRRTYEASKRAETRYVADLRRIFRGMHTAFLAYLVPKLSQVAGRGPRQDATHKHTVDLNGLEVHIIKQLPAKVGPAFDRMAEQVRKSQTAVRLLGIEHPSQLAAAIAQKRDENIRLVENAGRAYADDVRDIFEDPDNTGRTVDDLADMLVQRGNVSESRAELIARDQTLKLNGQVNQIRQTAAGIASYVWSTSHDERVRPEHAELDGQEFTWASGGAPDIGHPGEDIMCRCVAIAVTPDLEGGEDTQEQE